VISICYSLWLKNRDHRVGVVASGFFLRAYGGAVTSHITVSTWFSSYLLGALFLVWGNGPADEEVGVKATPRYG